MALRYLASETVRAWRVPEAIHLRLEIRDDRTILSAVVKRAFPLTHPTDYLSVQDGGGKEVGILRTLDGLEPQSRREIEEHLDRRYFTPQIVTIRELKQDAGMWRFAVETQRGPAQFFVRNWRDNANEIAPNRWHIHAVDGGRFEIENLEALDVPSRRLMDQLL
jgi:hypothetical protein